MVLLTGKSLLWTLGLGLVVLYIYGAIAYAGYQSYYDDPESSSHCRTLFQCVVSVIRLGLIMGGGLVTVSTVLIVCYCNHMRICISTANIMCTYCILVLCERLISCVTQSVLDAFSQNADGAFKDEALLVNFPLYIPRTVLDISFFIIVTTIGLGVIFGIIVDTFSELRDERVSIIFCVSYTVRTGWVQLYVQYMYSYFVYYVLCTVNIYVLVGVCVHINV